MNVVRRMLVSLRKGTMTEDEAMDVLKRFNSETLKYFGLNILKDGLVKALEAYEKGRDCVPDEIREVKAYITDAQKFAVLVAKSGIKQGSSILKDYAAGEFNRLMKFSNQDPLKNRDEEYKHIRTKDKRRLTKDISALDVGSFPECSSEFG